MKTTTPEKRQQAADVEHQRENFKATISQDDRSEWLDSCRYSMSESTLLMSVLISWTIHSLFNRCLHRNYKDLFYFPMHFHDNLARDQRDAPHDFLEIVQTDPWTELSASI